MATRRELRTFCLQTLYQQEINPGDIALELNALAQREHLSRKEKTFVADCVNRILDQREEIDSKLQQSAANWDLGRMTLIDRNIMRIALSEIMYDSSIPSAVSINEAIELAKRFGDAESTSFVNGVLDRIRRDIDNPPPAADVDEPVTGPPPGGTTDPTPAGTDAPRPATDAENQPTQGDSENGIMAERPDANPPGDS